MADLVVVAGAAGFIGRHLVDYLSSMGKDVIGLDRGPATPSCSRYHTVDLTDRQAVLSTLQGLQPRWVFNLTGTIDHTISWPDQRNIINQHLLSVLNLVEVFHADPPEAFVNIGSSDEYGNQPAPQRESFRESPIAPYSAAKVAATHYLQMLYRRTGFPAVVARFFLVYGPAQDPQRLIPWTCTTLLRGETMETTEGRQKRDFLFVQDAVEALVALAATPETKGQVFNVASGTAVSVRDVLETIQAIVGSGCLKLGARPMREGETMELFADVSSVRRVCGWSPRFDLPNGLRHTVEFYRALLHK